MYIENERLSKSSSLTLEVVNFSTFISFHVIPCLEIFIRVDFTYMLIEMALVSKSSFAIGFFAFVRFLTSMQSVVGFQDAFLIERTAATWEWALKVALSKMCLLVNLQPLNFTV